LVPEKTLNGDRTEGFQREKFEKKKNERGRQRTVKKVRQSENQGKSRRETKGDLWIKKVGGGGRKRKAHKTRREYAGKQEKNTGNHLCLSDTREAGKIKSPGERIVQKGIRGKPKLGKEVTH